MSSLLELLYPIGWGAMASAIAAAAYVWVSTRFVETLSGQEARIVDAEDYGTGR